MNILIDIGHPAHVHLFKHFAWEMQKKNHRVFFTCREKENVIYFLKKYGFDYLSFGRKYSSLTGKAWGLLKFDYLETLTGIKFKPDILLSHGSMYAAHAAFILGKPHISLEDTFNFEQIKLYKPFTRTILTADYEHPLRSEKVIKYRGYHELAYLHPHRFTPDPSIINTLGLNKNDKYVILRFVAWQASHDSGHQGISLENKKKAIEFFKKYARVFISSEKELPDELKTYKIQIDPDKMHDAIAFASLLFSESGTMAAEAAVLGVPSIYIDSTSRLYIKELGNKYGLTFNFSENDEDQERAIRKSLIVLGKCDKNEFNKRRQIMLNDKIDVTAFMVWFIENYPQSREMVEDTEEFWGRFQ